jgi:hypothetical protein
MKSTVILAVNDQENIAASILSVLESNKKPDNFCIALNESSSDKVKAVVTSFFKSCCDGSFYTEEHNKDFVLSKKNDFEINMISILSKNPIADCYDYIKNETDIFFTMGHKTVYKKEYIERVLDLFDNITGAVYTDFYINGRRTYLESMHPFNSNLNNVQELAFKKEILDATPKFFHAPEIISKAYSKSIIRNIPEALYLL